MNNEKRLQLIAKLYERLGGWPWQRSIREGMYTLDLPLFSIGIYADPSEQPVIVIYDSEGELIDKFAATDFEGVVGVASQQLLMQSIYEDARRVALGLDKAYDEVLKGLDAMMPL